MRSKARKRVEAILMFVVLFFIVVCILSIAKLEREKAQKIISLKQLSLKYSQQVKTNKNLRRQLSMDSQEEYIEEEAREKFNYAYPEEHIFVDVSGN